MTTGYVYDPIFLKHDLPSHLLEECLPYYLKLDLSCHPENKKCLDVTITQVIDSELLSKLVHIEAAPLSRELLARVHDPAYVSLVQKLA